MKVVNKEVLALKRKPHHQWKPRQVHIARSLIDFGYVSGERTVKTLRLSKALIIPEGTTVYDACRRMAARRINAVLLTDANALLSGIVTDKVNDPPVRNSQEAFMMEMRAARMVDFRGLWQIQQLTGSVFYWNCCLQLLKFITFRRSWVLVRVQNGSLGGVLLPAGLRRRQRVRPK